MIKLSPFEEQVINKLLAGDSHVLAILRKQFGVATVTDRQFSGAGFVLEFNVPTHSPIISDDASFEITDVVADISGISNGAGFVLYIRNGKLASLEGFTFDEPWPDVISDFQLRYREKIRDIPS